MADSSRPTLRFGCGGADPPRVRPDTINRLVNAVYPGFALLAGMQLDVFTPLAGSPRDSASLAREMGVRSDLLETVLYALAAAGLLSLEDGCFANTPEADRFLVRGSKDYIGSNHEVYSDLWSAALRTAETVRDGVPRAKHDFAAMSPDALRSFFRGLDAAARASARKLRRDFDFSRCRHLLDAGGGSGGIAVGLCQAFPELRATVADLPSVTPITREFIEQAGLADRIRALSCNFVEDAPAGSYDVAVLRAFVQVLSMEEAGRALANVARALAPGGRIYIMGRMLDDSRIGPPESVAFNFVFINIYDDGRAYTESEHRGWLAAAGFHGVERHRIGEGNSIMTAIRR